MSYSPLDPKDTIVLFADLQAGIIELSSTNDAALRRLTQAGVITTSVASIAGQLAGDFSLPEGAKALGVLYELVSVDLQQGKRGASPARRHVDYGEGGGVAPVRNRRSTRARSSK